MNAVELAVSQKCCQRKSAPTLKTLPEGLFGVHACNRLITTLILSGMKATRGVLIGFLIACVTCWSQISPVRSKILENCF